MRTEIDDQGQIATVETAHQYPLFSRIIMEVSLYLTSGSQLWRHQ